MAARLFRQSLSNLVLGFHGNVGSSARPREALVHTPHRGVLETLLE
jgi:hypothetical protein